MVSLSRIAPEPQPLEIPPSGKDTLYLAPTRHTWRTHDSLLHTLDVLAALSSEANSTKQHQVVDFLEPHFRRVVEQIDRITQDYTRRQNLRIMRPTKRITLDAGDK
jgi:hypothetical protein